MSAVQIPVTSDKFPAQLKELRKESSYTQAELAKRAQVSQQTISAIEQGKMEPSLRVLFSIAVALGICLLINHSSKTEVK